jgi:hypothetical protein
LVLATLLELFYTKIVIFIYDQIWSACPGEIWSYDQISPGQELQTHIQTDGNNIRTHTVQTRNERTSTESNLVTAQSTAHEPTEDGRTNGPKHIGQPHQNVLTYFKVF